MAKPPPPPICVLRGHQGGVTALHFTNDIDEGVIANPSLISGSDVGEVFIWNLKTHRSYHRFNCHNGKMILYIFYYKSSLVTQGRDELINVWRFTNNQWTIMNTFNCPNHGFCSSKLFFTEYCTYLVTPTGKGSSLILYDFETTNILLNHKHDESLVVSNETCMCIKVFQNGPELCILMGFDSGFISLWDYGLKSEKSRLKCHPDVIFCLDYDIRYKNRGISGSVDDVLQVWKVEDDQLVKVHQATVPNHGINAIKIRDDGKIVITAGQDSAIRVYSWKNLKPLAMLQFHAMPIVSLEFHMESFGKYTSVFASGSKDKNISLWSIY